MHINEQDKIELANNNLKGLLSDIPDSHQKKLEEYAPKFGFIKESKDKIIGGRTISALDRIDISYRLFTAFTYNQENPSQQQISALASLQEEILHYLYDKLNFAKISDWKKIAMKKNNNSNNLKARFSFIERLLNAEDEVIKLQSDDVSISEADLTKVVKIKKPLYQHRNFEDKLPGFFRSISNEFASETFVDIMRVRDSLTRITSGNKIFSYEKSDIDVKASVDETLKQILLPETIEALKNFDQMCREENRTNTYSKTNRDNTSQHSR